jgi:hypothetical protein
MATTVGVVGKSGSGKSTSIKYCDPKKTLLINCDGKSLPFKGWKSAYSVENKNYWRESDLAKITNALPNFAKNTAYDCIIIDTVNAIMLDEEMAKSKQKGFDKWMDLAAGIYELIQVCNRLRDDLTIVLMFHSADYRDDNTGMLERRILTNGRKLEKIQLETKLPIVLYTRVDGKGDDAKFYFETKTNDSTGKSPAGMFDTFLIENNLQIVIDAIKNYE